MLFGESTSPELADRLLSQCAEAGVDFFDTAEMYPVPQRAETQASADGQSCVGPGHRSFRGSGSSIGYCLLQQGNIHQVVCPGHAFTSERVFGAMGAHGGATLRHGVLRALARAGPPLLDQTTCCLCPASLLPASAYQRRARSCTWAGWVARAAAARPTLMLHDLEQM